MGRKFLLIPFHILVFSCNGVFVNRGSTVQDLAINNSEGLICLIYIYIYIYIYIVIHRQTVKLYHNSSVWVYTQEA